MPTYLPGSGTLSINDINTVFGRGNDLNSYRGTTWYTAAGGSGTFSSGAISISDFYSKGPTANAFTATISSHNDQLNLRSWALANGWDGSANATITLASGYYLYSSSTGGAALTIDGSWPGGLTFINNGYIMGMGGHGGGVLFSGSVYTYNYEISAGGNAINLGVSCTIQNNSYIGGGGGGGGGNTTTVCMGGGGAGGGQGGSQIVTGGTSTYGGTGGSIGGSGSAGVATPGCTGGGGGRIMPGSNTVSTSTQATTVTMTSTGGGGGNAGSASYSGSPTAYGSYVAGLGGSGGGTGGMYAFYYTGASVQVGGGGGGWGASGGSAAGTAGPLSGAAGGKCVNLNGYSVTWSATGTRYGAIS